MQRATHAIMLHHLTLQARKERCREFTLLLVSDRVEIRTWDLFSDFSGSSCSAAASEDQQILQENCFRTFRPCSGFKDCSSALSVRSVSIDVAHGYAVGLRYYYFIFQCRRKYLLKGPNQLSEPRDERPPSRTGLGTEWP